MVRDSHISNYSISKNPTNDGCLKSRKMKLKIKVQEDLERPGAVLLLISYIVETPGVLRTE
jgi:hypothetical protein